MFRRALKSTVICLRLLRHAPPERSHVVASRKTAKRLRGAIGMSCSGAYGSGGNRNIDDVVRKELAGGRDRVRKES